MRIAGCTTDITPEASVPLAGFSNRTAPFMAIEDSLEANVVALSSQQGTVVLVAVDALYIGALRPMVCERLKRPIEPAQLFMAASHSHFAPATDPLLIGLAPVDMHYLDEAARRIALAIDTALAKPGSETTLVFGAQRTASTINRRRKTLVMPRWSQPRELWRMKVAPNPAGPRDGVIRVVVVRSEPGAEVAAVLWSVACHPVAFPRRQCVSAEFPGVVRALLRQRFGAGIPVIFLQGFSGNVRPRVGLRKRGIGPLALGTRFVTPSYVEWNAWAATLGSEVVAACSAASRRLDGSISAQRVELPLSAFVSEGDAARSVSIHRVSLGRELCLIGVSAEPVAEYVPLLTAALPAQEVVPVGCIDSVYGYLPTREIPGEGGYEAKGFFPAFSLSGTFQPDLERTFLDAVGRLS